MAYVPNSGSVVAFQGNPSVLQAVVKVSNPGDFSGSIVTIPTGNQSVSGTVHIDNFSSVIANQLAGSILAVSGSFSPSGNQSVSGRIETLPVGNIITSLVSTIPSSVLVGTSIFGQLPAGTAMIGSIATYQGTVPWAIAGSVAAIQTGQSGTVVTSVVGTVSVIGTVSVVGTLQVVSSIAGGIFPISGSVAAVVTNNVTVVSSLAGGIFPISGSVAAVIIGGSIATATTNSSIMLLNGANTIGSVTALQGTNPWVTINVGSIITTQIGSVITVWKDSSILAGQVGTNIASLVSTVPSSVLVGASIFGQLPAGTAMLGSVVAYQGVVPWIIGSIYGNISGSVAAFLSGTQSNSVYGMRNDTIASFLGADLTVRPLATDSAGRQIIKPFASEDGTIINYTGSVVSTSVTLIQASVIGKRNYITDFFVANTGATTTLLTFQGGDTSIVGYTIAPTAGGSNAPGIAIPLKTTPSQDLAFKVTSASSIIYLTVKGYQAP